MGFLSSTANLQSDIIKGRREYRVGITCQDIELFLNTYTEEIVGGRFPSVPLEL